MIAIPRAVILLTLFASCAEWSRAADPQRVTVDNFVRAESDTYFAKFVGEGGFGKFKHERELASIDNQTVIRLNRDTLYSFAVFDLEASPVTVALPDPAGRFMSLLVINEDHYAQDVFYAPGTHTFTREGVGTRYVCLAIRTFVDPNDEADMAKAHALQDAIEVTQSGVGEFSIPDWDAESHKKIRNALLALVEANGAIDSARMFGRKDDVDPVQHLLGAAAGWGGNPASAALYTGVVPEQNDGKTPYQLTLRDVPVDGFWSISVYDKSGYFEKNKWNAYTVNNVTAKKDADGSVTIHFGGDESAENFLPISPGWNYLVRMYRPRPELLSGDWAPPVAEPTQR
jgi:hypothetical protein